MNRRTGGRIPHTPNLAQQGRERGARDTFAGGFIGSLAKAGAVNKKTIVRSMMYGSVAASFGVEDFSLDRLAKLKRA